MSLSNVNTHKNIPLIVCWPEMNDWFTIQNNIKCFIVLLFTWDILGKEHKLYELKRLSVYSDSYIFCLCKHL